MIIVQLAGFLGSGKTTLMVRLGGALGKAGKRVAVIVNEVGEVGVDGQVIEAFGLRTVELTEGCICCSLSGSLQNTVRILAKEYRPDVILIEPTGLALPSKVNAILRTSMVESERNVTVAIVDAYRAKKVLNETKAFFSRQISVVDLIALNKIDLVDESSLSETESMIRELNPDPPIVRISAKTGAGFDDLFSRLGVA
ncbi:MAG: GTP-binding protein [Methanomassiliicoccales archaeon]|jgi:G3E family GTPase